MNHLAEIPLFSGLSRVEQAKLLSDLEDLQFPAGPIPLGSSDRVDWLYIITEGEIEVLGTAGTYTGAVMTLGPGNFLGEWTLYDPGASIPPLIARRPVRLLRVQGETIRRLFQAHPERVNALLSSLTMKLTSSMEELSRTKAVLEACPSVMSDTAPLVAAVAVAAVPAATAPRARMRGPLDRAARIAEDLATKTKLPHLILTCLIALLCYYLINGSSTLRSGSAILVWATLNWLMDSIPDYAVGLTAAATLVVTGTVPTAVAFSGFSNSAWLLLVGAGGMGVAVTRSGLLYRASLHMLRRLPATFIGQSLAMAITGILFTPLLPSANSRVAVAGPLAQELSEGMRYPARGNGAAGLALSTFLGFGVMYFLFLNGANTGLLAWSLLPVPVRAEISWMFWFVAALPMGALIFVGCYAAILRLYPPEQTRGISAKVVQDQLQVLGPLSRMEVVTAFSLGLVLLGFMTQGLHRLDPAWLALFGFLLLLTMGVVDRNGLKSMDWGFLLLFGTLVSVSEITKVLGLSTLASAWLGPMIQPLGASPYLLMGFIAMLTLIIRLVLPLQPTVFILVVALSDIVASMGYNPFLVVLVVLALSNTWIVPQQNSIYLGLYSATEGRSFSHRQARPLALVHAALGILAVLITVPFWRFLGLISS